MSDYHLTSLYILTKESNIKVIMQEMTTLSNISWFSKKFSYSVPQEMFREQYGEFANWC